ncbi:vacuolar alkaline phosphatase [Coemansia sp. Benny D115]|nr:vacuolar alkaline phosphatase [Coemansia sp. Benny D115]
MIMMISDGFGSASETMGRDYAQQLGGKSYDWLSVLDELYVGVSRTKSSDTLVTDSAAGATVFSCAKKTYNGAIAVTPDEKPCGTVLEAAKLKGYTTALVSTARITHATPAAFASHVVDRDMEVLIAEQLIGRNVLKNKVDLMFGGGRCFFLPNNTDGSCRTDSTNAWRLAETLGYSLIDSRKSFDKLESTAPLPLLGLFTSDHMSYEIDRNANIEPSLTEMTTKALDILYEHTRTSPQGFFIMVEGARIDMAGHDNDPAAHLHDIIQYWETVDAVRKFVDRHPDTSMVSTSDHETGGLTIGIDPDYLWYPAVLQPVKKSAEVICREIKKLPESQRLYFVSHTVIPDYLGIKSSNNTASTMRIVNAVPAGSKKCKIAVGHVVSDLAHLGWSTGGHTGVDVGLYTYGQGVKDLKGNLENTQIGDFLASYLQVDLDPVTQRLENETIVQDGFSWTRNPPSIILRRDGHDDQPISGLNSDFEYHEKIDPYHPHYHRHNH